jgi:hypothetical protein
VSAERAARPLACSRCGRPLPGDGPLTAEDRTPISVADYLAVASLVGDALVCSDCVAAPSHPAETASSDASTARDAKDPPVPSHREIELGSPECWRLLSTRPIGRLGFTDRALPAIRPTHFVVHDEQLVLATLNDRKVVTADRGDVVAFEVEDYDQDTREGWWVSTVGRAGLITDRAAIDALDRLCFTPWSDHPDRHYIAVQITALHGRRLIRHSSFTAGT